MEIILLKIVSTIVYHFRNEVINGNAIAMYQLPIGHVLYQIAFVALNSYYHHLKVK